MEPFSDKTETGKEELSVEELKAMWLCPKCRGRKWKERTECFGCTPPSEEELQWEGKSINSSRHKSWLLKFGWKDEKIKELQLKRQYDRQGGEWQGRRSAYKDSQTLHNGAYGR